MNVNATTLTTKNTRGAVERNHPPLLDVFVVLFVMVEFPAAKVRNNKYFLC